MQHPRWGSNLDNQLSAREWRLYGEDGYRYTAETYRGFFGGQKTRPKKEWVGNGWYSTNDDNKVGERTFRHRCGLLKMAMAPGRNGPMFVAFLDGHVTSNFASSEVEFRFAPDDLRNNDGKPTAEVWFSGTGRRHGPLHDYKTSRISCTFADKEQMDQYLDLTNRRMPKSIIHKGVTYSATPAGTYQSDDGSMLPLLLMTYFLLSSNEQQAFAAQNPEVQSMLGDTSQSIAGTDGPTYSDGGSPSSGADFGSGSSFDSGGGSFDSGGGSSF